MEDFRLPSGQVLRVHARSTCTGRHCCIHHPSDHVLRDRPLHWRADRRLMERLCPHGIGHPDPDDVAHHAAVEGWVSARWYSVHGCDGCCSKNTPRVLESRGIPITTTEEES